MFSSACKYWKALSNQESDMTVWDETDADWSDQDARELGGEMFLLSGNRAECEDLVGHLLTDEQWERIKYYRDEYDKSYETYMRNRENSDV